MAYDLTLDGVVIGEMSLNDNDKLLTLLTSKKGKMIVLAKGIKSIHSKRSAGAQLFCYSTFGFVKRDNRFFLDSIEVKDNFQGISEDVESVALASYFAEVASGICMEESDESEMLRLLLNSFYALAKLKSKPKWMIKAAFELKCMCIQGFSPNFDNCCLCGSAFSEKRTHLIFEMLQGGFVCEKCISDETFELSKDGISISPECYFAIKQICLLDQGKMLSFVLPVNKVTEFSRICEQYLIIHTEKKFKTLDYYHNIVI